MRRARSLRLLLATALVAGGVVGMTGAANAAVAQVDVLDFVYNPDDTVVTEGDTVVFRWRGDDSHTVSAFDESFDSGIRYPGADYAVTFETPGSYSFFCMVHGPAMSGTIEVMPEGGLQVTPASADNVAEAIAWSKTIVPDGGAAVALLGRDDAFPDSLASGALQGALGAPLLVNPTTSLDDRVKAELARLGVGEVVVLGGEAAISNAVVTQLEAAGYAVTRVSGPTRIGTTIAVAKRYFAKTSEAILARAYGPGTAAYADALGAGALAARVGIPVLVTPTDSLDAGVKAYLSSAGVKVVHIAGGTSAISEAVETELEGMGITVNRLAGETRYQTNALLADVVAGDVIDPDSVVAVIDGSGDNADAWVSGFAAALSVSADGHLIVSDGAPTGTPIDARYYAALVDTHPAVICGPDTATACSEAVNAASVDGFFEGGGLMAVANTASDASVEGHRAALDLRPAAADGTACWMTMNGSMDTPIVASHVHRVSDNAAVFGTGAIPPGAEQTFGCGSEINDGDLAAILATPSDYYWNIHFDGTTETVKGDIIVTDDVQFAFGTGGQEVPGPGDPAGFTFTIVGYDANDPNVLCAAIIALVFGDSGPEPVTGAHIHTGEEGVAGPIAVPLDPPPAGNMIGGGCVSDADVPTVQADPLGHYVNLHSGTYPAGAVRGQLVDIVQPYSTPEVVS